MKLIGIPLRKPSFNELTAAAVMGSGLWLLIVGLQHAGGFGLGRADAGALLVVVMWGSLSARFGIHVGQGDRHLVANVGDDNAVLGRLGGTVGSLVGHRVIGQEPAAEPGPAWLGGRAGTTLPGGCGGLGRRCHGHLAR